MLYYKQPYSPSQGVNKGTTSRTEVTLKDISTHTAGNGIAHPQCVELAVPLDAASWVLSSSEENFPRRGDFSLGVNMGSDSISPKLGLEYNLRSSLCTPAFHGKDPKNPDIHVLDGWMPTTKNTSSMYHPRRWNVTTSVVGLRTGHIRKNLTKSGEPQRYSWGRQKKKKNLHTQQGCTREAMEQNPAPENIQQPTNIKEHFN